MNILYINHYAGHPEYGMEFRPFYLGREWHRTGHSSLVLGADFSHLRRKNPKAGFEQKDNVNYYWIKTPAYKGNGFGRVCNIFTFVGKIFFQKKKILKHIKPDAVVASSTHPFDIFPAWWIAKTTKAKLVFEIHDLWPLSLTELGGMQKYHPFVLLVGLAEILAFKLPDKIISILPNTFEHAKRFGVKQNSFSVVPNGIIIENNAPSEKLPSNYSEEIEKLKQQGKFLVCYAGAHGIANALRYLIDAAKTLENNNVHIVLIGDGQEKENLIKYTKDNSVNNITFIGRISKDAIPDALSKMDALYIGLQKQPLFRFGTSANKMFDYMLAAKPIISSITAGNDPVADANCGVSVEGENEKAIADAIIKLINTTEDSRQQMGKNGKDYVLAHHDYKILARDFLRALE